MTRLFRLKRELKKFSSAKRAKASLWFFKTGKGEYGEGDVFWGITVPEQRKVS
ncbi:MAG: DNA alkylation repair protein [bacterium]|nr:DNA alkylation repair protein [bacterium]